MYVSLETESDETKKYLTYKMIGVAMIWPIEVPKTLFVSLS
jgi:hypothetical protein